MSVGKFIIRLLAYSAFWAGIILIMQEYTTFIPAGVWGVFGFFFAVSIIIYLLSRFILKTAPATSVRLLLITLMMRLFLSFGYFILYVSFTGDTSYLFATVFMILYLLFTIFENYHLVINLRPDSKNEPIANVHRQ